MTGKDAEKLTKDFNKSQKEENRLCWLIRDDDSKGLTLSVTDNGDFKEYPLTKQSYQEFVAAYSTSQLKPQMKA